HRAMSVDLLAREAACAGLCRDLAAVSDACGRGIAEVEQDRHKVSAPLLQDTYLQNKVNLYRWGVFAAWQLGDTETMLTRAELSKAHAGLGWLFRTDDEALAPGAGDSDLEREFVRLSEQLNDASREAAARRRSAWDRLMMGRIRAGDGHSTVPRFSVGAVQSALGADEVVVYHYWLTEAALLVVTLDRTSVVAERKTLDDQTRGDLELLALHPETPEDFAGGGIDGLSALLLPVEGAPLLAGKDHLILSPHRLLHQLPLHALPFDGAPLIRRFAVTYVANLTSLLLAYPSTKAGGVLALAVTDFSQVAADLPDLAGTVGEVEGVCALFRAAGRAALVVGDRDASVAGFEAHCADRSFGSIHLATHASSIVSATPLESRLYLVDGVLDGLEIARLDIGAELIVLSACSAGQRAVFRRDDQGELAGDEVFGLQAAFFAAGARQVVGALWPVEDEVSSRVLTTFHRLLLGDRPPAVALQQAMLTELDRGSTRVEAWAPFHLVAMGRPR
ncbi:MAG: CHAT domain-containing protein, partial [Actinomycetota bacterium]|nr:CHAT domain-containing protein [Actinomycetota bacterium]